MFRSEQTPGPVSIWQTIRPHAVYQLHIDNSHEARCSLNFGPELVVPTKTTMNLSRLFRHHASGR